MNPAWQRHLYDSPSLTQEAPFWQGLLVQATVMETILHKEKLPTRSCSGTMVHFVECLSSIKGSKNIDKHMIL